MGASAGLRELARKADAGEIDPSAWADLKPSEPGYDHAYAADVAEVDPMERPAKDRDDLPACGIYFPCRPWTPAEDGARVDLVLTAPDGEPCVVAVCKSCGDGLAGFSIGDRVVCGACHKVGDPSLEAKIAASR